MDRKEIREWLVAGAAIASAIVAVISAFNANKSASSAEQAVSTQKVTSALDYAVEVGAAEPAIKLFDLSSEQANVLMNKFNVMEQHKMDLKNR